ncbi:MAG: GNAT family N-acetyltransferase, partial [Sphingomonadales bacterium]|nr:GNAT family N-acetyltransferase [Sphingomonadales bacterium]
QMALLAAEDTRRFLGNVRPDASNQFNRLMRHAGGWSLYGYGMFFVRLPGEDRIIGNCGVFHSLRGFGHGLDDVPEAGWIIHPDRWGKGIAREAMGAVLAWFDEAHGPHRIAAMIDEGNAASQKVAAALGFAEYGRQEYEGSLLVLYERLPG